MLIADILRGKGNAVHTIRADAPLLDAVSALVNLNIGSLLVRDEATGKYAIVTERDILRTLHREGGAIASATVDEVMTTDLVVVTPDDEVGFAMQLMTENHVRHLPVIRHGDLCGLISIGDLVKAQADAAAAENDLLHRYIHGDAAACGLMPGV